MTARTRLPHRRECDAIAFRHDGIAYVGKVSRFEEERLRNCTFDEHDVCQ